MTSHIQSYKTLALVLGCLLVLTAVTVGASYVDLGRLNVWVALAIASVKGSLVLLFFMHMRFEGPLLKVSFLSTIGFLAIMIGFTFWDIAFR
jgi:cytochrome c oxidase subunit 4